MHEGVGSHLSTASIAGVSYRGASDFPFLSLHNASQALPKGRYLASLKVLDLEGNRFAGIPPALAAATQLVHLDMSCNQVPCMHCPSAPINYCAYQILVGHSATGLSRMFWHLQYNCRPSIDGFFDVAVLI